MSIRDLKDRDVHEATLAYVAAKETEPTEALNDVDIPPPRPYLWRPDPGLHNDTVVDDLHGHMDDFLFSARQDLEDEFREEDEGIPPAFYAEEEDGDMAEYLNDAMASVSERLRTMSE